MGTRPLAFGARFREDRRTVRVQASERHPGGYVVEIQQRGKRPQKLEHTSLAGALRHFAKAWRGRLH